MSTTDTRAAFEAQEKHNSSNLKRDDTGQYENPCTQSAWEGWQAALAWQVATEAAKPAQEEDSQIRWCAEGQIFGRPTATDALEYAEQRLRDPEEMSCCKSDIRLDAMLNVRELLSATKATGAAGEQTKQSFENIEELPPLPECAYVQHGPFANRDLFTVAQMREYGQACAEAARQPAPVTMPPAAWAAESTTGGAMRMLTKISLLESEVDRYVNREDMARIGCDRVKVPLYRAAPLVDYTVLHEWANAKGVSYNELCAVVRAATNRSQP